MSGPRREDEPEWGVLTYNLALAKFQQRHILQVIFLLLLLCRWREKYLSSRGAEIKMYLPNKTICDKKKKCEGLKNILVGARARAGAIIQIYCSLERYRTYLVFLSFLQRNIFDSVL
jgi:hypothetical protein